MKRILVLIFSGLLVLCLYSQSPGKFNYQAVARNTAGNLIINQNISVRISILTGSPAGAVEYSETHSVTSDAFGVFNLLIGGGTLVSGSFDAITWGSASKFLKIEADITGGTTYQPLATTQILSMPYALYANESGTKTFNDDEFSIIYAGGIATNPATAPTAVLAGMGAGSVDNGIHDYKITFITSAGETGAGPASAGVTVDNNDSNGRILVSAIPISGGYNVTSRNIYRRFDSAGDYKLLTTLNDNSTTTYIDNLPNSSLGKVLPLSNSTTNGVRFDASGITSSKILKIPDYSGTIVLNESTEIPVQTKTDRSIVLYGKSVVRELISETINFGEVPGEFCEAYTDADGKNNTVNVPNTSAIIENNKYSPLVMDNNGSNYIYGGISGPDLFFDNNSVTYSSWSSGTVSAGIPINYGLGKTFSIKYISKVYLYFSTTVAAEGTADYIKIQSFDGTSWNDLALLTEHLEGYTANSWYEVGLDCSGIRIYTNSNRADNHNQIGTCYTMNIFTQPADAIIEHIIPSGTFSSTISSVAGVPLIANWEEGSDIQYMLSNNTEDSGWLPYNTPSTFLQFSSEPTKLIVKLIPKSSNPTPGYPAIYGFYVTEF